MSTTLHSYIRIKPTDARDDTELTSARQQVRDLYEKHLAGYGVTFGHGFEDAPESIKRLLVQRPAGRSLAGTVQAGDIVLFPMLTRSFKGIRDLLDTVGAWTARGVRVWVYDLGLDTGTAEGRGKLEVLRAAVEFERGRKSDRHHIYINRERAKPKEVRRKLIGRPPWGTRANGRAGHRRLEVQPEDYAVGKLIVEWRLKGFGWQEIHTHLKDNNVTKPVTRERKPGRLTRQYWTVTQIRKAYTGMIRLMRWIEEGKITVPKRTPGT